MMRLERQKLTLRYCDMGTVRPYHLEKDLRHATRTDTSHHSSKETHHRYYVLPGITKDCNTWPRSRQRSEVTSLTTSVVESYARDLNMFTRSDLDKVLKPLPVFQKVHCASPASIDRLVEPETHSGTAACI